MELEVLGTIQAREIPDNMIATSCVEANGLAPWSRNAVQRSTDAQRKGVPAVALRVPLPNLGSWVLSPHFATITHVPTTHIAVLRLSHRCPSQHF